MTRTASILEQLRRYESRNVTFVAPDGSWPIAWERAKGEQVWDAEGRKYLDLTAAFGVAAAGHANPRVVRAGQRQMATLLHAMGDVHPHALKAKLARELSRITFERWTKAPSRVQKPKTNRRTATSKVAPATGKTIFCNSGFEAVEAALKTALLATSKPGVIAFEGGYHGVGYGALNATHREQFRVPFRAQLGQFGHFVPFPANGAGLREVASTLQRLLRRGNIGAILVEPIQARGGINVPPAQFLPLLRRLGTQYGALLVLDEIYTGFGRTGTWFACEQSGVIPDLICFGKALTGGFPLSACVGRAAVMDAAWPESAGEAIHTSTFLGHPVGCAMALAQIREIEGRELVARSAFLGAGLLRFMTGVCRKLRRLRCEARGAGLMVGLEVRLPDGTPATQLVFALIQQLLRAGFIFLPEGSQANVLSFTPPLTIARKELDRAARRVAQALIAWERRL